MGEHDEADVKREALLEAMSAFFSEVSGGGYLTDFVLCMAGASPTSGDATIYYKTFSNSPLHSLRGLAAELTDDLANTSRSPLS